MCLQLLNVWSEVKWSEIAQSFLTLLTLCDPRDCSPPGSFVHGILQARILEWVAISFSRGSSQPRDQTQVSHTAGRYFNHWATHLSFSKYFKKIKMLEPSQSHSMNPLFWYQKLEKYSKNKEKKITNQFLW